MKKLLLLLSIAGSILLMVGCQEIDSQTRKDSLAVERQQKQVSKSQPVPAYPWSLERHLLSQLYDIRNVKALTHSVWRSDRGLVEGDCASIGFGIPYDTSLTNPLTAKMFSRTGKITDYSWQVVEQPEPNSVFASKNTAATWVMCAGKAGSIEPIYVETKVTTYPYPVTVDYDTNRVTRSGKASVNISMNK